MVEQQTQTEFRLSPLEPMSSKVINVGSDTFGNPIFHEGLQN